MLRLHGTLHDGEPLPRAVPATKIGPFRGRKGPKKQQKYAKIKRNQPKTMNESEALGRSKRPLRAHRRVHDGLHLRLAQHTAAPVLELGRFRRIRHPNHPKSSEKSSKIKQNQAISRSRSRISSQKCSVSRRRRAPGRPRPRLLFRAPLRLAALRAVLLRVLLVPQPGLGVGQRGVPRGIEPAL